jgi:membrane carboxypeptidase/penicillin-binding protein PbpC
MDEGSIQADGKPLDEGASLENAFRQAKKANLSAPGRLLSLERPEPGKDDTMSTLAASLQKSAEKASSRASKPKPAAGSKRKERSAPVSS